jgi:hypothetical protein
MPTTAYTPIIIPITVTEFGVTIDFSAVGRMAAISLENDDAANEVFAAFDGMPPTPALQNGVFGLNPAVNPILNLENITFVTVGLKTAAGKTAVVQAIAFQRSGGGTGGGGFGG